jgi:PGF-pre-PGF domain-containing protein
MVKVLAAAVFAAFVCLISAQASAAFSVTENVVPVSGFVDFDVESRQISLHSIQFRLPDQGEAFQINVQRLEPDDEWVYEYFYVDAVGLYGHPQSIFFEVKISKEWIETNQVEASTIAVSMYDETDDEWETAKTVKFSEDREFVYYRASFPKLETLFVVTGEPYPFEITVTSHCNGNDVCEPELGEDSGNCRDCLRRVTDNICIPGERTCLGDNVFICRSDGRDYLVETCEVTCYEGACVDQAVPVTGMILGANPMFLVVVALLSSVIAYLAFTLRRMRETLSRVERLAASNEDVKALAEVSKED